MASTAGDILRCMYYYFKFFLKIILKLKYFLVFIINWIQEFLFMHTVLGLHWQSKFRILRSKARTRAFPRICSQMRVTNNIAQHSSATIAPYWNSVISIIKDIFQTVRDGPTPSSPPLMQESKLSSSRYVYCLHTREVFICEVSLIKIV